jgi:hypothetical protein
MSGKEQKALGDISKQAVMAHDAPKRLFIVSPIGDEGSEIRTQADLVYRKFIQPAAEGFRENYKVFRIDELPEDGIRQRIWNALDSAAMVVVYLGSPPWNPNVMFEAGYRLGAHRPVLLLCHGQDVNSLPFDLKDFNLQTLPPFEVLKNHAEEGGRTYDGLVRQIADKIAYRAEKARNWVSSYAVAEILIDQTPDDEDDVAIFTAASSAADELFHVKQPPGGGNAPDAESRSLYGMDILDADKILLPKVDEKQLEHFQIEQNELLVRLLKTRQIDLEVRVPLIFKSEGEGVDDPHSPSYVAPKFRGRAFLAIIVQHRQLTGALFLRLLYFEVTNALKKENDHFVCELSKVERQLGAAIREAAAIPPAPGSPRATPH